MYNASDKTIIWSSTDSEVATVDENGVVTALGKGEAIIVVKTDDGGYRNYCVVTVK